MMELKAGDCPAYIIAGGRSSRFGSDKARVEISGRPLLQRLKQDLESQGHEVNVVADQRDRYADLDVDCLVDLVPGGGPTIAALTALEHRRQRLGIGWTLLLACDQVCWYPEWFDCLSELCEPDLSATTFVAARRESSFARITPEQIAHFVGESVEKVLDEMDATKQDPAEGEASARSDGEEDTADVLVQPLPGIYHTSFADVLWGELRAAKQRGKGAMEEVNEGDSVSAPKYRSLRSLLAEQSCGGARVSRNPRQWSFNTREELDAALARLQQ